MQKRLSAMPGGDPAGTLNAPAGKLGGVAGITDRCQCLVEEIDRCRTGFERPSNDGGIRYDQSIYQLCERKTIPLVLKPGSIDIVIS
jgi:hypothetical protein